MVISAIFPAIPVFPEQIIEIGQVEKQFSGVVKKKPYDGTIKGCTYIIRPNSSGGQICYTVKKSLGTGSTATCYLVHRWKKDLSSMDAEGDCVLKVVRETSGFCHEVSILQKIVSHPNIIKPIEAFSIGEIMHLLVLEAGGQTLERAYICNSESIQTSRTLLPLIRQILEGLKSLHDQKIMHLDIKPRNLVVNRQGHLKIIDFDSSEFGTSYRLGDQERKITLFYRAPEHDITGILCPQSDVWSVACTIYALITKQYLFYSSGSEETLQRRVDTFMRIFNSLGGSARLFRNSAIIKEYNKTASKPLRMTGDCAPHRIWEKQIVHRGWASLLTSLFQYVDTRPSSEGALALLPTIEADDAPIAVTMKPQLHENIKNDSMSTLD